MLIRTFALSTYQRMLQNIQSLGCEFYRGRQIATRISRVLRLTALQLTFYESHLFSALWFGTKESKILNIFIQLTTASSILQNRFVVCLVLNLCFACRYVMWWLVFKHLHIKCMLGWRKWNDFDLRLYDFFCLVLLTSVLDLLSKSGSDSERQNKDISLIKHIPENAAFLSENA